LRKGKWGGENGMTLFKVAAMSLAGTFLAGAALAQAPLGKIGPAAVEQIRMCADRMAAADRFSGVIRLEQDGRPLLEFARSAAGSGPFTMDTPFHLASASKMFTAVAVAQMAEQG
jgi:CubicO group peptidase (beta-lactamase class C family)